MGQWISSREFAESSNIGIQGLLKAVKRAFDMNKKFCHIKGKILPFKYTEGIGRGGKVLQIWDTPLSPKQVEVLEKGYPVKYVLEEMGEVAQPNVMESKDSKTLDCKGIDNEKTSQNIQGETLHTRGCNNANECASRATSSSDSAIYRNDLSNGRVANLRVDESMEGFKQSPRNDEETKHNDAVEGRNDTTTWHNLTSSQKSQAKQRERILQDYESAKASGIRVADFLMLKNSEDSTLKLTQGKLFDWQRKYKAQGLGGLSDKRGVAKLGTTSLPAWAQEEAIKMWRVMGSGYLNRMQLWRELHIIAHTYVEGYSYKKFLKREIEPLFSFNTMNRFLDSYLKANSLEYTLITYGSDKTDSYKEPAFGMQREPYTLPNQLWQIDSSPLDAIVLDRDDKQICPSILS